MAGISQALLWLAPGCNAGALNGALEDQSCLASLTASGTLTPTSLCCFELGGEILLEIPSTSQVDFYLITRSEPYFQSFFFFSLSYFIEVP